MSTTTPEVAAMKLWAWLALMTTASPEPDVRSEAERMILQVRLEDRDAVASRLAALEDSLSPAVRWVFAGIRWRFHHGEFDLASA